MFSASRWLINIKNKKSLLQTFKRYFLGVPLQTLPCLRLGASPFLLHPGLTPLHWATPLLRITVFCRHHPSTPCLWPIPTCFPSPGKHPGRRRRSPAPGRRPEPGASNSAWSGRGRLGTLLFPAPRRSAFKASTRCSLESTGALRGPSRRLSTAALPGRKGAAGATSGPFPNSLRAPGPTPELEFRLQIVLLWIRVKGGVAGND